MADGLSGGAVIGGDYDRPAELGRALSLLAERPRVILAGGTDLYPATTARALRGDVLDITGIAALRGVTPDGAGWRIGAATTWSDLIATDLPPAFDALKLAAREVGSCQIQNAGTIAGNLCNASPAADGVPPLLALDASVDLACLTATRSLPLAAFLTGPRQTALETGEIVTGVRVPKAAGSGASDFLKLGARWYLVISIAMVAVRLVAAAGRVSAARVAVGACSAVARRIEPLEAALIGASPAGASSRVTPALIGPALAPIDDVRGSAVYRAEAAAELIARAVSRAAERLG